MTEFLEIVQSAGYFDQHTRVLVAVSGGRDSMTLLNWLLASQEILQIELGVVHINHHQRAASDHEAKWLQDYAQSHAVPFFLGEFRGVFSEQGARVFRYDYFRQIMQEKGYTALVTGHHAGDQSETILMRLIRGSRLRHLSGIKAVQDFGDGQLIRPLLRFNKAQLDAPIYFEDASNQSSAFFRNRVRLDYLPQLRQDNPKIASNLISLGQEIDYAMSLIADQVGDVGDRLDLQDWQHKSAALQYFTLQTYLTHFPLITPSKQRFEQLWALTKEDKQYVIPFMAGYYFVKDKQHFYLTQTPYPKYVIAQDGDWSIRIPKGAKYHLRAPKTSDQLIIRGHHKRLKKVHTEQKTALVKRQNPVLLVDDQIYGQIDVAKADVQVGEDYDILYFQQVEG